MILRVRETFDAPRREQDVPDTEPIVTCMIGKAFHLAGSRDIERPLHQVEGICECLNPGATRLHDRPRFWSHPCQLSKQYQLLWQARHSLSRRLKA